MNTHQKKQENYSIKYFSSFYPMGQFSVLLLLDQSEASDTVDFFPSSLKHSLGLLLTSLLGLLLLVCLHLLPLSIGVLQGMVFRPCLFSYFPSILWLKKYHPHPNDFHIFVSSQISLLNSRTVCLTTYSPRPLKGISNFSYPILTSRYPSSKPVPPTIISVHGNSAPLGAQAKIWGVIPDSSLSPPSTSNLSGNSVGLTSNIT